MEIIKRIVFVIICLSLTCNCFSQYSLADFVSKQTFNQKKTGDITASKTSNYFYKQEEKCIVKYSFETGKALDTVLNFSTAVFSKIGIPEGFSFNSIENKILLHTQVKPLYRYSFYAKYYVYSIDNKSISPIADSSLIRDAGFSPDGTKVAFSKDNNMFIQNLETGNITRLTHDGKWNYIINGCPDWVYEEEFSMHKAYQWSANGRYLSFLRFDESEVKEFPMTVYGTNNYPEIESFKYPKAGEKNSVVQVLIYDSENGKLIKVDVGNKADQYIPRICWTLNSDKLAVVKLNRRQNKLDIILADALNGISKTIYTETNSKYIDELPEKFPIFVDRFDNFLITSERNGARQVFLCNPENGSFKQITQSKLEITEIIDFDDKTQKVFYSSHENTATQNNIYSVSLNGNDIQCLTPEHGSHAVIFNFDKHYFIDEFSSALKPLNVSICKTNLETKTQLINNENVINIVRGGLIPLKELFTFNTNDGIELNAWIIKPATFDSTKKYPLLLFVYGGPGRQTVLDNWEMNWYNYLATQGYIVVSVDNRGTDGRGEDFKKATYKNLGNYEVVDQIATAQYFASKPYIDASRIGIYGWSYGGYMAAMCILKGASVFRCAIAVAPPVNWRFYDSVYTERYMDLPANNETGYKESAVTEYANLLKGKFLLIHGTADDNVHFQNSMALTEALVQANVPFEMAVYPDKNHGIRGGNTRLHLYTKMTEFLEKNLKN